MRSASAGRDEGRFFHAFARPFRGFLAWEFCRCESLRAITRSQARNAASSKSGASAGKTCQPVTALPSIRYGTHIRETRGVGSRDVRAVVASHTPLSRSWPPLSRRIRTILFRRINRQAAEHGARDRLQRGERVEHELVGMGLRRFTGQTSPRIVAIELRIRPNEIIAA